MRQSPRISTKFTVPAVLALAALSATQAQAFTLSDTDISSIFTIAGQKYMNFYNSISANTKKKIGFSSNPSVYGVSSSGDTSWSTVNASDWRAGFFPGVLWQVYDRDTSNTALLNAAQIMTFGIRNNTDNGDHDVGFRTMSSYGQGAAAIGGNTVFTYQGTADLSYNQQIESAADFLASRYIPAIGLTRSWNNGNTATTAQVIVDNMMNIQVLFQAAKLGDTTTVDGLTLSQIAIQHARTTFQDFVRPDGSSVHEVIFNLPSGTIQTKQSVQGITTFTSAQYQTEGCWSRGESWLIQGFTQTFVNSNMPEFLSDAQTVANYWCTRTLANVAAGHSYIPPADFDYASPDYPGGPVADDPMHQDTSAGASAADGLMLLASVTTDPILKAKYWSVAVNTLQDLVSSQYLNSNTADPALLEFSAQQFSIAGENSSFDYGDYYLLQALTEYQQLAPSFAAVPEPTSLALLGIGGVTLLARRRKSHN